MVRDSALPAKKRTRSVKAKPEVLSIKSSADSDAPIPRLGHYVVDSFDPENMVIKTEKGDIKVDAKAVNEVLGLPMGGEDISQMKGVTKYVDFHKNWMAQFKYKGKGFQKVFATEIAAKIGESENEVNEFFKMNFLMLFLTSVIHCENGGKCPDSLLQRIGNGTDLLSLNWCGYVLWHLKGSKKNWKPHNLKSYYCGPATFLILLYLDRTQFDTLPVVRERPVFKNWNMYLKAREILEVDLGRFGVCPLRPPIDKDYDNFHLKLIEFSNQKRLLFEFFNKQKDSNPEDAILGFYCSKLEELFQHDSVFYDGESPVVGNNPVNDQQNAPVEEKQNSQNDELANDDVDNEEECFIYKNLPKKRRRSNAGCALSNVGSKEDVVDDGGPNQQNTYERKKARAKKTTMHLNDGELDKAVEENEATGVEKVKDGSKVAARKGRGRPPKAADETQKNKNIVVIEPISMNEVVPKITRRTSERIVRKKISVNVSTKDGKGLEKDKPVNLA